MGKHDFHRIIRELIDQDSIKPDCSSHKPNIICDPACEAEPSHVVPLYHFTKDEKKVEFSNVDILIEVDGKPKVIIEIEESNVKPIHIFGKFFASAFSNKYKSDGNHKVDSELPEHLLFIQILELPKTKRKSHKPDQWKRIERIINDQIPNLSCRKDWEYKLLFGPQEQFLSYERNDNPIVKEIKEFLLRYPN